MALLWIINSGGIVNSVSPTSVEEPPDPLGLGCTVANRVPFSISLIMLNCGSRLGEKAYERCNLAVRGTCVCGSVKYTEWLLSMPCRSICEEPASARLNTSRNCPGGAAGSGALGTSEPACWPSALIAAWARNCGAQNPKNSATP